MALPDPRRSVPFRNLAVGACCAVAWSLMLETGTRAQQQPIVGGSNVNMVSGTTFPDGDPFLQRQNEPSSAASTRNPLHLLAGANDYRTVDLPGTQEPLKGFEANADAWLGVFKSFDGGQTWRSTLLPGFPQDTSPEGLASPLKGRQAGTDPVVRAGTNGLFYYAGVAFDRGEGKPSVIFVSRFWDLNNREAGDPIAFLSTKIVASSPSSPELDKTALAVDVPRTPATCTLPEAQPDGSSAPKQIPAGNVYVAYAAFTGEGATTTSQILFSRSLDCGETWSRPINVAIGSRLNQNAQIAVDPVSGAVYVSWRAFKSGTQGDGVFIAKSTNAGASFGKPVRIAAIYPYDQGTSLTSFRSNGFQTMTVDAAGRVYVAWSERGHATLRPNTATGDARIVVSSSTTGTTWTVPRAFETGGLGHQLMPALSFQAGRLRLIYYDLREDVSQVFGQYVDEKDIQSIRHTLDVYVAQAAPGASPVFRAVRLSDYASGFLPDSSTQQQLQFNPPNLPLFRQGTVPFMGDYLDLAPAPPFVIGANGQWTFNTQPTGSTISHAFWTDNRDVRAPVDGNWQNYTPVTSDALQSHSIFDPSQIAPSCVAGHTGMRNQNIYTARVTEGLFVGSPGNAKPLDSIQRAFVVAVQNENGVARSYRLSIANQPAGGTASFAQFAPGTAPQTTIDVSVPPFSSVVRSVYASTSSAADAFASIRVNVNEISAPGAAGLLAGGLNGTVVLNADPRNPSIQNPSIQNPSIQNPSIQNAEVYNPNITTAFVANPSIQNPSIQNVVLNPSIQNPSIQNPSIQNPALQNDAVANATIINPSIQNPSIQNPSIQNPSLQNPSIQNSDVVNGAIEDTTWVVTNEGNTTASYAVNLVLNGQVPAGFGSQLLVHKTYSTPAAQDCTLALQPHTILLVNVPNPVFTTAQGASNPSIQNPSIQNPTISLTPGESADVTLRITDPNRFDGVTFDASASVTPAIVAHSVNTEDAAQGITQPRFALPLTITTAALASATPGGTYQQTLQSFAGSGNSSWSVSDGTLPPGLQLDSSTGVISGTPTTPGNYVFTVRSADAAGRSDTQTLSIQIDPTVPPGFSRVWNGADSNWSNPKNWSPNGVPGATDDVYVAAGLPVMPALTQNVTVHNITVEPGATLNTNGFTLTVTGDAYAGKTIVGSGFVALSGGDAHISGTFPNVVMSANANVALAGPVTVDGDLRLDAGARLTLNGLSLAVTGSLITSSPTQPPLVTSTTTGALLVGGVDVNGLTLVNVTITINGGALTRFDNVVFDFLSDPDAVDELTINHPGATVTFSGISFLAPALGRLVVALDTQNDGVPLVIRFVNANQADGTSQTATAGGATVTWSSSPGDANLAITSSAAGAVVVGGQLTYTLAVVNGGPAAASGVVVRDTLPAGVTFVSATGPGGACPVSAGVVTCGVGAIPAGQAVGIQITVNPGAPSEIANTATVQATTPDPVLSNNATSIRTSVLAAGAAADVSITKTDSADPVAPGAAFSYTITVRNAGPATATTVLVRDEAPAGATFTAAIPDRGTCTIASGVVTCSIGSLTSGQTATISVTAVAGAAGMLTNYASISTAQLDPDPTNNVAVQTTMVAEGCSVPAFSSPAALAGIGGEVFSIDSVDFDGDGAKDLITSSQGGRDVVVFFNDGRGHFNTNVSFSGAQEVRGIVAADFTGDGLVDIAAVRTGSPQGDLVILRNSGARGFGTVTAVPIGAAGTVPFTLAAADFNEDGHPDLAVELASAAGPTILLNDGAGNFSAGTMVPAGSSIQRLAVGDFNEDGHVDLVVGHLGTSQVVSVLTGNGDGTFAAPANFATNPRPRIRAVADLNEDGHLDLVVVDGITGSPNQNQLTTLFGDGHGAFGAPVLRRADGNIHTAAVADVNGDGHVDLVSTDLVTSTFGVQFGDGSGNFGAPLGYGTPFFSNVVAADFNGDGRPDVALGDAVGVVRVFNNSCGQSPIDVSVTVSDSPDPVAEGTALTYTATVRNLTGTAMSNVTVLATLPQGMFVGSTSSAGGTQSVNGAVVAWTVPSIGPNAIATFQYTLTPTTGGTLAFTVGVTADGADTNPANNSALESTTVTAVGGSLVVTSINDSGPGSLRQAIMDSNADTGDVDHVTFNIPGAGVHTITLLSSLPAISQPVVIDASTQPGFSGTPLIEVNGNGVSGNGLQVNAGNSTIRGLAINRFAGQGIVLAGGGSTVEGNVIGSDPTGTLARPNTLNGIFVTSANNLIGGTAPGAGNFIGGNTLSGILISGTGASGNTIRGNLIGSNVTDGGLDPMEALNSLEPSDILQQQSGTATISTAQNHTTLGTHSIALTPTGAGPHNIAVGGPINDTPIFGTATIYFYDAGPGLAASFEMINSVTGAVADIGTQDFDPGCYRAFVAPTPGDVRGPNASVSGCATNVATTHIARSVGWHKLAIRADGQNKLLSIDDQTVFELAGTDGFDFLQAAVSGSGSGPAYFFDDLSLVPGSLAVLPNGRGVEISDAPNTVIGGTASAARNVISGNAREGIRISGAGATGTVVQGNYIGTNTTGSDQIGNGIGIAVFTTTTIGGSVAGAGNVISGNVTNGVNVSGTASSNSVIQGNIIGPRADLSDQIGSNVQGILVDVDVSGTQIGGTDPGAGNIVASSQFSDIAIRGTNTTIQGNTISTDPTGTFFWSSGGGGISLATTASNNIVGGTAPGARNLISGTIANHLGSAISIGGHDNRVEGNYIGTNANGEAGAGNGGNGVGFVSSASNNIVGGTAPGTGNVIAGSYAPGVTLNGNGNLIAGNRIGTNAEGTQALPNGWGNSPGGVTVLATATGNRIGAPGAGNLVSGNPGWGVLVDGADTVVMGNVIGLNAAGTGALPNGDGIRIGANARNARIGGTGSGEGNVVSGNSGFGISLFGTIGGHLVQGNNIGTNVAGTGVVGNTNTGIWIPSPNNTIGGSAPGAGNVVAGNLVNGIQLSGATAVGNVVQGNWIGTDRTNTLSLGNTQIGIDIIDGATNAVIGGPGTARNTITHNQTGVQIRTGSAGNVLHNNAILANAFLGVNINDAAVNNTIGGTGAGDGNVIQGNGKNLVVLNATSVGNAILGNSISGSLIGIDLGNDGVTPNDLGDADTGPNSQQNFPVLTSATVAGSTLTVPGTLNSTANTAFRLEFFSNATCDPTGNGDGDTFLGSLPVTTDGAGSVSFTASLPAVAAGQQITATATDPANNTSEFSTCRPVSAGVSGVSRLFVVNSTASGGPGSVSVVDPSTNTVINVIPVGLLPQRAELTPDGTRLYVTNFGSNSISVVDTATNAVIDTITSITALPEQTPMDLTINPAGTRAYVLNAACTTSGACSGTGSVFDVDLATKTAVARIPVGGVPADIAMKPDGSTAYVANQGSNSVSVIDLSIDTVIATIPVGVNPRAIAITPDGARAYVLQTNNVSVIDLSTNTVTATVPVGPNYTGIGVTLDGTQVYASRSGASISRISTTTNTVVGSIAFVGQPGPVEMMTGNRAYVGVSSGAEVRLIDTSTNTITTSIPTYGFNANGLTSGLVPANTSSADLLISLSDDPDPATAGGTVAFTIPVTNNGPNPATNVVLTTTLASGTVVQSFSGALACNTPGTIVTCTIGTIAAGTTATVTLNVRLAAGTLTTTARVNAAEPDPQIANNVTSITTTVNNTPTTFTVTNTNDSGTGSLRQAIVDANARAGALDTIAFNIPGSGVHTIAPLSGLPTVTDPVVIDGSTQPGYAGAPIIELSGASAGSTVGLTIAAGGSTVRGLAINAYAGNAIAISGGSGNAIEGNYIGTDATGSVARGNLNGIVVQSANNRIGGTSAVARNLISGNSGAAVYIQNAPATGNVVQGNYIGTNASGNAAIPNTGLQSGVLVQSAANNTIGGSAAGAGNVVSGNAQHAITICCDNSTTGNIVQGNFIGTTPDGTTPLANGGIGLDIVSSINTTVGGPAAARNVIMNNGVGIQIRTGAGGNVLHNNLIASNRGMGVRLDDTSGNLIGGTAAGDGNVIQNNTGGGIVVLADTASKNSILGNSVAGNDGLGIDLNNDGPTANDTGDADSGPNDRQNHPLITSASVSGATTTVAGTLNSTPSSTVRLEFFSNGACDPSGFGEGRTLIASTSVTTAADGTAPFSISIEDNTIGVVTATATGPNGSTSEFSPCTNVGGAHGLLLIPNRGLNALQELDTATLTVVRTLPLPAPYTYSGGTMLSTVLVRPEDGTIVVNVRNGSGTPVALALTSTGQFAAVQASPTSFLQQIAFDPADLTHRTVIGGVPFDASVAALNPFSHTTTTRFSRSGANFIGLVTDPGGKIFAGTYCGPDNGAVLRYGSGGAFETVAAAVGTATGSCEVNGLAMDPIGELFVAQNSSNRLAKFGITGAFAGFVTAPSFNAPSSVFSNGEFLYVGNDADDRLTILRFDGSFVGAVSLGGSGIGTAAAVR